MKKSVFENFCERFGVSEETKDRPGKIYLDYEELEAKAEADDLSAIKGLFKEKKAALALEPEGFGKEARKLPERYEKLSKEQIKGFSEKINVSYARFEDAVRSYMTAYELAAEYTAIAQAFHAEAAKAAAETPTEEAADGVTEDAET